MINVFHAGDGNLHPLLVYDAREPGMVDKVHEAGREIVAFSVAVGGVLSGEHGIGLEKRDLMPLMFSEIDLSAQEALRVAFDPQLIANPEQGAAESCDVRRHARRARRRVDLMDQTLDEFAAAVGTIEPVSIEGSGSRGGAGRRGAGGPSTGRDHPHRRGGDGARVRCRNHDGRGARARSPRSARPCRFRVVARSAVRSRPA